MLLSSITLLGDGSKNIPEPNTPDKDPNESEPAMFSLTTLPKPFSKISFSPI